MSEDGMFSGDAVRRVPSDNGWAVRTEDANHDALRSLIGRSGAMDQVRDCIRRIARSPVPVLILGETGTGKELCAEAIFNLSKRRPFVAVNCAAIPEQLAESELFGHERGAFTGAVQPRAGLVEQANRGILFLDELGDLPDAVQAKLLRTLETGQYRRVGSMEVRRSEFRILAATSDGVEPDSPHRLRLALLHRVGAARIWMPPLRERVHDIPLLVAEFLNAYRAKAGAGPLRFAPQACSLLMDEPWPGNVRQLRNVVEVAAAWVGREPEIGPLHMVRVLDMQRNNLVPAARPLTLAEARIRAERRAVFDALRMADGNRERAAKLLDVSEATLYRKLANGGRAAARSVV